MKVAVDTNVIAYALLGPEKYLKESEGFLGSSIEAHAPALWEAELANVLWMAARHKVCTLPEAIAKLALADRLGINSVPNRTLWQGALVRAHESRVAVYDTLFVELAAREEVPLATFDAGLLKAFPEIAFRPADLVTQ